jgi:hypothetical protein
MKTRKATAFDWERVWVEKRVSPLRSPQKTPDRSGRNDMVWVVEIARQRQEQKQQQIATGWTTRKATGTAEVCDNERTD